MSYKKTEEYNEEKTNGLMEHYREVISLLGEDPDREGLKKPLSELQKQCST